MNEKKAASNSIVLWLAQEYLNNLPQLKKELEHFNVFMGLEKITKIIENYPFFQKPKPISFLDLI